MTNNVKNIKDAANSGDQEGKNPPKYSYGLKITLDTVAREQAIQMMKLRGMEVSKEFEGPDFARIAGYQVNGDWVAVTLEDNTSYIYPARNIARVKHYINKE